MVTKEEVLEHLVQQHEKYLRETEHAMPLSLSDYVTVNYTNLLYRRSQSERAAT